MQGYIFQAVRRYTPAKKYNRGSPYRRQKSHILLFGRSASFSVPLFQTLNGAVGFQIAKGFFINFIPVSIVESYVGGAE